MTIAYRLSSSRYPTNSGKGAALHGGRWNPPGTEVIYAAESRSLAALEVLVHYAVLPRDHVLTEIHIPDHLARRIEEIYPNLTRKVGASVDATRGIGGQWLETATSVVLSVPSAIIPEERNYVLNVGHAEFSLIEFLPSKPFHFDPAKTRSPRTVGS